MPVSRTVLPLLSASILFLATGAIAAPTAPVASGYKQRPPAQKPVAGVIAPGRSERVVTLKFHEGSKVRLDNGVLTFDGSQLGEEDLLRLSRQQLSIDDVYADVKKVNALLAGYKDAGLYPLSNRAPDDLDKEREKLEQQESEELADLNLYTMFVLGKSTPGETQGLIDALNALSSVEIAYAEPLPADPSGVDLPPTTFLDLTASQGYALRASLGGIDKDWAARLPGGLGDGIRVMDVEAGLVLDHEDVPNMIAFEGVNAIADHGVAVIGVMGAVPNTYGITGLVPQATYGASSVIFPRPWAPFSVAIAVENAGMHLRRGDVMLIEQHYPDWSPPGVVCKCNCPQFGYLPAEGVPATFDMIRNATARGIIVVEAAGNGSMNLDDPFFARRFDRTFRDSNALMVGAALSSRPDVVPQCWTNFGARVDVNGWGDSVATLGYGDVQANGPDPLQWYTMVFSGTSSATPIVASATVAVNASRMADGLNPLDPFMMRLLLSTTGVQQTPGAVNIGARPDLRAALAAVTGTLEDVNADGVASGFAFQSNRTASALNITFEVDGLIAGYAVANRTHSNANLEFGITGSHGFLWTIPARYRDGAAHNLVAFAEPVASTGQIRRRLLQTRTFQLAPMLANVEGVSGGVLRGWAIYGGPTANQPLTLEFVKVGIGFGTVPTRQTTFTRIDINARYDVTGTHGFEYPIPSGLKDGYPHTINVYARLPNGATAFIGQSTFQIFPTFP